MGIYPTSDESTATNPWRIRYGFVAFFLATAVLWVIACNPIFANGCREGNPHFAAWCAGIIEVALVAILFRGLGAWRFTAGFFTAFLLAATFTRGGAATPIWLSPGRAVFGVATPLWAPVVARQQATAAQNAWVGVHRTQHPSVVHATRLANLVHECAQSARTQSGTGGFPRSVAELTAATECEQLRELALAADDVKTRFTDADNGWRWSYRPGPPNADGSIAGYTVRVLEDPVLERPAPEYTGDESGVVREERSGTSPRFAATPVASLVILRRCLTRVPAERARLTALRGWPPGSPALHMVLSVCPELNRHIGIPYQSDVPESGTLAVQVNRQAGEFTDTAAVYRSEFIPADVDGLIFELQLTPVRVTNRAIHGGIRRFFVARDGSVHATSEDRPATGDDPIAAECLPGGDVDCSVAGAAVAPTPGS